MMRRRQGAAIGRPRGLPAGVVALALVILIGSMASVGCGSSTSTEYRNESYGFSLTYPSGFLKPIDDPTVLGQIRSMFGPRDVIGFCSADGGELLFVSPQKTSNPEWMVSGSAAFYRKAAATYARLLRKAASDVKIVSAEGSQLGGRTGIRVTYQRGDRRWVFYHLYRADAVFDVGAEHTVRSPEEAVSKLEAALASFNARPQTSSAGAAIVTHAYAPVADSSPSSRQLGPHPSGARRVQIGR
jgi:hypothetical protein